MERDAAKQQATDGQVVRWDSLKVEIMELIFAWLPVKDVVRVSCVCLPWFQIVHSHSFLCCIMKHRGLI